MNMKDKYLRFLEVQLDRMHSEKDIMTGMKASLELGIQQYDEKIEELKEHLTYARNEFKKIEELNI